MPHHASSCDDHVRYTAGCEPCRERSRTYAYRRHWGLYGGTWDRMVGGEDLERVRDHVRTLMAAPGATMVRIGQLSGLTEAVLRYLPVARHIRPDTAQALLALTPRMLTAAAPRISSVGAMRRLQALARDGWDSDTLAQLLNSNPTTIKLWRVGKTKTLRREDHWALVNLFEKIQGMPDPRGPSAITAQQAERFGYLPVDRWLEEDLDDPDAMPLPPPPDTDDDYVLAEMQIEQALRRPSPGLAADFPRAIQREIAKKARALDWTFEQIAELLGKKSAHTIEYMLNGRPDRPHTRGGR